MENYTLGLKRFSIQLTLIGLNDLKSLHLLVVLNRTHNYYNIYK